MPNFLRNAAVVLSPEGERLGYVEDPLVLEKILANDAGALIHGGRHPAVILSDVDAWLLLARNFHLSDYQPDSYVYQDRAECGRKYFELVGSHRLERRLVLRVQDLTALS